MGPGGRDGAVPLLDRNRRLKRKPQWLDNTVASEKAPAAPGAPLGLKKYLLRFQVLQLEAREL